MLILGGILLGIVGLLLVYTALAGRKGGLKLGKRKGNILAERLKPRPEAPPPEIEGVRPKERVNLLPRLTALLTQTRARALMRQLEQALALARIPLKPAEFMYVSATALFVALVLVQFATNNILFALVITLFAGFAPFYYLHITQKLRFMKLDTQVADTLLLMTNSLRAGSSFMDSMDVVSREMPPPISEEFTRALREVSLGIPVDEAFIRMSGRCHSEDLDLAVTAFMIQREVGGNLSEILANIAETIRERMKLKQEIRTLSAQGKLSGGILCALPVGLTMILHALNPDYLGMLFTTAPGRMMLMVGVVMQIFGILAISRIVKLDV